eukprot:gene11363-13245_t
MKTGLFFGSFNPVHTGHLVIASYMANFTDLDEVWMVVSPHNPLKNKKGLSNMYDRLEMVRLATEHAEKLKVSNIEFGLPQPSYTVDTLAYLKEKYPGRDFALIMGGDNLVSLQKWKNYEVILNNYRIYVYPRPGADLGQWEKHPSVVITDTPQMDISSTFIRKALQDGKNVRYFLPDPVLYFIEGKNMYR